MPSRLNSLRTAQQNSHHSSANITTASPATAASTKASACASACAAAGTAATGTDGATVTIAPTAADGPSLRIAAADPLDLRVVATGEVDPARLALPGWRAWGALVGPLLSLAGLLYLAHAAGTTRGGRL